MRIRLCGAHLTSSNSATRYHYVDGTGHVDSAITRRENIAAEACTIDMSTIYLGTAPGSGKSWTFTMMLNGVAQTHEIVIADLATSGTDSTHPVSIAAGDRIAWRQVPTNTPAGTLVRRVSQCTITAPGKAFWGTSTGTGPDRASVQYGVVGASGGDLSGSDWNATEDTRCIVWAIDATITKLYVKVSTAPLSGRSWTYRLVKNGSEEASSQVAITDTNVANSISGLSIDVAPGDTLSLKSTPAGSPVASDFAWGIGYTPDTDGQWNVSGINTSGMGAPGYVYPNHPPALIDTLTAADVQYVATGEGSPDVKITAMRHRIQVAPGVGKTRSLTVQKNLVSSNLATTMGAADTVQNDTGLVELTAGDALVMEESATGSPTASGSSSWGLLMQESGGSVGGVRAQGLLLRGVG